MADPVEWGLIADIIANPDDATPRLILADWLADHDDPREHLLRFAQGLLDVPWRAAGELRPDLPCDLIDEGPAFGLRSPRKHWPVLSRWTGYRHPSPWPHYSRFDGIGRLLTLAFLHDALVMIARRCPAGSEPTGWHGFRQAWARYLLANCGLLTARERDAGSPGQAGVELTRDYFGVPHYFATALCAARSHQYGCFVAVGYALVMATHEGIIDQGDFSTSRYYRKIAVPYSRFLDVYDHFRETAPWETARELARRRNAASKAAYEARLCTTCQRRPKHPATAAAGQCSYCIEVACSRCKKTDKGSRDRKGRCPACVWEARSVHRGR